MMKKAFTLIELLIVVAIIAILAAIAVPNFLQAQTRAKVSRVMAEMRTIANGLEEYYVDHNSYVRPSYGHATNGGSNSTFDLSSPDQGIFFVVNSVGLTTPEPYITSLPKDPFSPRKSHWYGYITGIDINNLKGRGRWLLTSYGPDNDGESGTIDGGDILEVDYFLESTYEPPVLVYWKYDSSNGSVSEGDLYRTSMGSDL